mmetsp:Transcript_37980/g.83014  ORF Transcript_37980/g.83014 Transcript_37980/m.83014 type:complete len:111 (-) Transcript_37980:1622-1954(-)
MARATQPLGAADEGIPVAAGTKLCLTMAADKSAADETLALTRMLTGKPAVAVETPAAVEEAPAAAETPVGILAAPETPAGTLVAVGIPAACWPAAAKLGRKAGQRVNSQV